MSDEFLGLLLLAGIGLFAWLFWPVSIWLAVAFAARWALRTAASRLKRSRERGRRSLLRVLAEAVAGALAEAVTYVGIGIFLVAVAQAILWGGSQVIAPNAVRSVEESLSWARQALEHAFGFNNLLIIMLGLVLVALLAPRIGVIEKFLTVRKWAAKLSLVLLGLTSFTFFSAVQGADYDAALRQVERYTARIALKQIDEEIREVTAATWVEAEVHRLDGPKRKEFTQFFQTARASRFPTEVTRAAAAELGRTAPRADSGTAVPDEGIISARERKYVEDDLPGHVDPDEPTLAEVRSANERLSRHELRLRAVRTTAIELAAAALTEIMPKPDRELVKTFMEEAVSTVAKTALREVVPTGVVDAATARDWLNTHVAGADTWKFSPSALEPPRPDLSFSAAEAATALVKRLEAQQAAREAESRRPSWDFRTPGSPEFRPPGSPEFRPVEVPHPTPHPTILPRR
jgi:hypothetical protein